MTETEKWINESLKSLPHLCAEIKRLSKENDDLCAKLAHAKLDRSRWNWCSQCKPGGQLELDADCEYSYCPYCGLPLTEGAWEELETRLICQGEQPECDEEAGSGTERNSFCRSGWAVAWYALLTAAGVLLYKLGAACALRERGYYAVGGETLALLLPVLYYCGAATIRDIVRDMKDRR